ncbi:MAG: hypothetical protein U1F24_13245 [Alphaproteobacteria bacterium]
MVAGALGLPRRAVYARALELESRCLATPSSPPPTAAAPAERRAVWLLRLEALPRAGGQFPPGPHLGPRRGRHHRPQVGRTLVFVEVMRPRHRGRGDRRHRPGSSSASPARRNIKRRPRYAGSALRFDAMVAEPGRFWPRHVIDAFRPEPQGGA